MTRLGVIGVLALGACVRTGPRPVPPSMEVVVNAAPGVTQAALRQAVTDLGLPLRPSGANQVETEYVDIATFVGDTDVQPLSERLVRFIVTAVPDPNSSGSRVAIRCLYDPFRTGLDNVRRSERGIPSSHPAMEVVRDLMERIRKQAEGG